MSVKSISLIYSGFNSDFILFFYADPIKSSCFNVAIIYIILNVIFYCVDKKKFRLKYDIENFFRIESDCIYLLCTIM